MSVNHEDVNRIQEWIAELYETSPEKCPVSRDCVRKMCRGPMKDVFLKFLLPRFRSDAQVKTIRSNLFLHDVATGPDEDKQRDEETRHKEEVKKMKEELAEVVKEKEQTVSRIVKHLDKKTQSSTNTRREIEEALIDYGKSEANSVQAMEKVEATNTLLRDVDSILPSNTLNPQTGEPEDVSQLTDLKSLYENALELFDVYCGARDRTPDPSSSRFISLTGKVDRQTAALAHSGMSPTMIEKWAREGQDQAISQIKNLESKLSNVMNPVEEFSDEAQALYIKLMQLHVNLRLRNIQLKKKLRSLKHDMKSNFWIAIKDPNVDTNELMRILDFEKKKGREQKVQELDKFLVRWERALESDDDLLKFISEESVSSDDSQPSETPGSGNGADEGTSASSSTASSLSQETLEDLTCALIKSFPDSRQQLEATLRDSKRLMLEVFPKFCEKLKQCRKVNPNLVSPQIVSTEKPIPNVSIPENSVCLGSHIHSDPLKKSELKTASADYLTEIFKMDSENERKAKECESLIEERGVL